MTKARSVRNLLGLLMLTTALAGGAYAGSGLGPLLLMPAVGAARPAMPVAPGTITTPVTPHVPRAPVPGRSTITIPGASNSAAPSTRNAATVHPCGGGGSAAGTIPGNAGIATEPRANADDAATVPNIPLRTNRDVRTTINPSVRPGVPSSC